MQPTRRRVLQHDRPGKQPPCALDKGQVASCRWTDNSGRTSGLPAAREVGPGPPACQARPLGLLGCRINTPRAAETQTTGVVPDSLKEIFYPSPFRLLALLDQMLWSGRWVNYAFSDGTFSHQELWKCNEWGESAAELQLYTRTGWKTVHLTTKLKHYCSSFRKQKMEEQERNTQKTYSKTYSKNVF